jgi:hypothetical protein
MVPSTQVIETPVADGGGHFAFHNCVNCGQLVHRVVGWNIANANGTTYLIVDDRVSDAEKQAVLEAIASAITGH